MSSPFRSLSELRALGNLINSSIDQIEQACQSQGKDLPSLHEPSSTESEAILLLPDVMKASNVIVAAAAQLTAAVRPPTISLFAHAHLAHVTSCLNVVIRAHVTEILRDAGPTGLHVKDIAQYTGINPNKLAHVLRLLVTTHVFKEVAPDRFANNRLSADLDTGKNIADILADPQSKYDGTASMTAILEHLTSEALLGTAHFADVVLDPTLTNSQEPTQTAFNVALRTELPIFEWMSLPEQAYQSKRFAVGMHGAHSLSAPGVILKGVDWKSLPKDSIVVDVAGGIGTKTLTLAKEFDHLKFVVQDRPSVITEDAVKFWGKEFPDAISSGRVRLQTHDMFSPQPVQDASIFIVRAVMHDWSDEYCIKILSQLRAAATPTTQLVVIDNIIPYACDDSTQSLDIPGARDIRPDAPAPLLPNFGAARLMTYYIDISMLTCLNGQERTVAEFANIFQQSGWKLVRVYTDGFNYHDNKAIGIPA